MAKRKKKNTVLGLDIGARSVKAVEMMRAGDDLSVTGCAYEPVEGPDDYGEAIGAVMESGGFNAKQVVIGFSGRSTMLQNISIPADRADELDVAILEEAEKYIPYDISEAQIDYHVFESGDSRIIKALMVAVRQQDIEDKLEILFGAGITPMHIDVELIALANAIEVANADGFFQPEGKAVGLVDFGASKTLITVTDGTNNVFREFPVGGVMLTEMIAQRLGRSIEQAEELKLEPGEHLDTIKDAIYPGLEDIAAEIRSCADSFKALSGGMGVESLMLSGGLVSFPGVPALVGRLARCEARIFESFGAVDASDVEEEFIDGRAHEFIVALGLASHAQD